MPSGVGPLLILDGGLESLVALSCTSDDAVAIGSQRAAGPCATVWLAPLGVESHRQRRDAVGRQAVLLNAKLVGGLSNDEGNSHSAQNDQASGLHPQSRMLLDAAEQARRCGCTRIIWPVHAGAAIDSESIEVDRAALSIDRALLVEQLTNLDAPTSAARISIETPYVDLSDRQLAELAADVSVPLKTLWWWGRSGDEAQRAHERWDALFRMVGLVHADRELAAERG